MRKTDLPCDCVRRSSKSEDGSSQKNSELGTRNQELGTSDLFKIGEVISTYNTTNPQFDSITQLSSKSDYSKIIRSNFLFGLEIMLYAPVNVFESCFHVYLFGASSFRLEFLAHQKDMQE